MYINAFAQKIYIEDSHEFLQKVKDQMKSKPFIIWQKREDYLIGVLYRGSFDFPPTIEGRFFQPSDFNSNKNLAVIGKNIIPRMFKENNTAFIDIRGEPYQVIGIIGHGYPSPLDDCVYFNLDSNVSSSLFFIDGKNAAAVTGTLNGIKKLVKVKQLDDPPNSLGRLFGYSDKNRKIGVISILVCLATIILSAIFFMKAHYNLIIVQHLIGISLMSIAFKIVIKLFAYLLAVIFIGTSICTVILPYIFIWPVEMDFTGLMVLLGVYYLLPQLAGTLLLLYTKWGGHSGEGFD